MLEIKDYNMRLENFIEQLIDRIPLDDMAKYVRALELRLPDFDELEKSVKIVKNNGEYTNLNDVAGLSSESFDDEIKSSVKQLLINSLFEVKNIDKKNFNVSDKASVLSILENCFKNFSFINKDFENLVRPIITTEDFRNKFFNSELKKSKHTKSMLTYILSYIREHINLSDKYMYEDFLLKSENINDLISLINTVITNLEHVNYIEISWTPGLNEVIVNDSIHEFYSHAFTGELSQSSSINGYYLEKSYLKEHLISDVIYTSASDINRISKYDKQSVYAQNGNFIPKFIFEKIIELLPANISKAMSNYYMFLSGDEVNFSDKEGKKYSFSIDNIHILGLKNDISSILDYFEKIIFTNQIDGLVQLDEVECPTNTKIFGGKVDSLLGEFLDSDTTDKRISYLNNVQGIITDYMTKDDLNNKIELLVYFYNQKNRITYINNRYFISFINSEKSKLDTILDENTYYFGQKFIKDFKTNKRNEYFEKFCLFYNTTSKREEIVSKYDNIFKVQNYLDYQHKFMAKEIISLFVTSGLTREQIGSYFTDIIDNGNCNYGVDNSFVDSLEKSYNIKFIDVNNYEIYEGTEKICKVEINDTFEIVRVLDVNNNYVVESNSKRRIKINKKDDYNEILSINFGVDEISIKKVNKRMNVFSLADIYINANCKQINNGINVDLSTILSFVNIFKLYDKCLYLNNFNFSTDISNLFITDLQRNADIGIICEMSALKDALYVLFDYMDNDGSTHFISIQDAESLMLLSSMVSLIPSVIDFDKSEYKTIFGFCQKDGNRYKNVLTQTHSDFRKKLLTLEQFKKFLTNKNIIFRYATSGDVNRTYNSTEPITMIDDLNLMDLIKRNLCGCSNALLWLENINYEQLEDFTGIPEFSIISDKEIFDEIRILLYRNVMNNVVDIVDRIDSELLYQDMLTNLNTFRVSGDSSLLDQLKLYLSSNVKSFSLNELNLCLTKEKKADYIQQLLKTELRMYLLPSQIDECKLIRKQLLEFVNTYSLNNIDSIVNMNSFDKTTFEFIRTMNDDELRQFIENIRLRYPSYLIDFMYYKFIDYSDAELEIRSNVSKVKDAVYNRKFFDVKLYSKDKINSMVSLKDSQRAELIYLEDKIVVYENYIRFSKNTDVSIEKMFQLHLEQFGFLKQKKYLLSIKKLEMDEKVNEKGVVANVKKIIDDPSVRKEKIENEIRFLDAQFDYYSSVIKLYDILNKIINSNSSDISVELINELFLLGEFYKYLSSSIKNSIKVKINELLENDELDINLKSALKSVELRISCEGDIKGYFDNILKSLYNHKVKLSKNNEKFVDESIFSFSQLEFQKSCLSYHQNELDNELLMNLSSMYQYISVVFEQYPKYRKEFLADIEKRVAFLYSDYPKFKYKDLFTLIVGEIGEDLKLNNSRIYNKIRMKLGNTLDSVASSDEMFTFLSNCLRENISECEKLFNESCKRANLLLDSKYYMIDGETEKHVKERLLTIIPEIKIIDTYIDCVMSSLSRKLNDLSNNYSWYSAGTEYNYSKSPDGLYAEGGRVDYIIRDLISSYLATLYQLLLLKREDGTPIIEDERKIDYYWAVIKERCIEILRKNSFYSNMIVSFINSEELTSVRVGGR